MSRTVTYELHLPYIVQPKGTFVLTHNGQPYEISIEHNVVSELFSIVTGLSCDPESPPGIQGPRELYIGFSRITITWSTPDDIDINEIMNRNVHQQRNEFAAMLNDLQYRYLVLSQKYWWQPVSADHFVMVAMTGDLKGYSSVWSGSGRRLFSFRDDRDDPTISTDLQENLREGGRLPVANVLVIEAKRHYLQYLCQLRKAE